MPGSPSRSGFHPCLALSQESWNLSRPFKWQVQPEACEGRGARVPCPVSWAGLFAVTKLRVDGGEWQLDVDGEVRKRQEVISPDKRPYGAVKTTGLGLRKLELKLGPTPLQLCDPVLVSPSLGLRTC